MSLPGWHPDPSGDYEVRYWDGSTWTDAVANAGQSFECFHVRGDLAAVLVE